MVLLVFLCSPEHHCHIQWVLLDVFILNYFYSCTSNTTADGCVLKEPHPMESTGRSRFILEDFIPQRDPKLEQGKRVRKFYELTTTPISPCTTKSGRGKDLEESQVE